MAVIAYRRWGFRIIGAERKIQKPNSERITTFAKFPKELEKEDGFWEVSGPIDQWKEENNE